MKIFVITSFGRTAVELGGFCKSALEELGHSVGILTYNDKRISSRIPFLRNMEMAFIEKALLRKISDFGPQLILVVKGHGIPLKIIQRIKKEFKIPLANYWADDPHYIDVSKEISPSYDYFFTNDPESVRIHKESGCPHVAYLSFGCMPKLHRSLELSQKERNKYRSDVCFAGTVDKGRAKVIEALIDFDLRIWSSRTICTFKGKYRIEKNILPPTSPLYHKFTDRAAWDEELVKVYNASKIVLNIHSPQSVPIMRDYEVTGCGAFLLTDYVPGLNNMFKIGKEIVCYKDTKDLRNLIEFYLEHSEQREEIAHKGQIRAYRDHTYAQRMKELLSFVTKHGFKEQ